MITATTVATKTITLSIGEKQYAGLKVESVWEGFTKLTRGGDFMIVADDLQDGNPVHRTTILKSSLRIAGSASEIQAKISTDRLKEVERFLKWFRGNFKDVEPGTAQRSAVNGVCDQIEVLLHHSQTQFDRALRDLDNSVQRTVNRIREGVEETEFSPSSLENRILWLSDIGVEILIGLETWPSGFSAEIHAHKRGRDIVRARDLDKLIQEAESRSRDLWPELFIGAGNADPSVQKQ